MSFGRAKCKLPERLKRLLLRNIVVIGGGAIFDLFKFLILNLDLFAQLLNFFLHLLELSTILFSDAVLVIAWTWLSPEWLIN